MSRVERLLEAATPEVLLETAGRLHPLVLHLPIGLLLLLAVLEVPRMLRRGSGGDRPPLVWAAIWLAALGAAAAAFSGWHLAESPDYVADRTLQLHRWLGVGVAATAGIAAVAWTVRWTRGYRGFLLLAAATVIPAGHFGGVMTHGEGFVTAPLRAAMAATAAEVEEGGPVAEPDAEPAAEGEPAPVAPSAASQASFALNVLPILDARCAACHGDRRRKGGLGLISTAAIAAGGVSGPVVPTMPQATPEAVAEAELLRRILLPMDDDLHMPPAERPQPTDAEVAVLRAWIAAGAPLEAAFDLDVAVASAEPEPEPEPEPTVEPVAEPVAGPEPAVLGPEPAVAAAIAAIEARFATARPIVPGRPGLLVDLSVAPAALTPAEIAGLLEPLARSVVELGLARTEVDDSLATILVRMPFLQSLDLRATAASDTLIASLLNHPRLERLVMAETPAGDAVLAAIADGGMPALGTLNLWNSGATPEAVAAVRAARPEVRVIDDSLADIEPIETEPPIALSSDRPLPGAADEAGEPTAATATAAVLRPVNDQCPVGGVPADPRFAIVHEGRVIAFCCADCATRFWADPSAFPVAVRAEADADV